MIPRTAANRFANRMGVDLHIAQQEVVLLYALDALATHRVVDRLVFKGGTYVRMMVTGDAGRLSEDLDFTNNGLPEDPRALLDDAFAAPHFGVQFQVVDPYLYGGAQLGLRGGIHPRVGPGEISLRDQLPRDAVPPSPTLGARSTSCTSPIYRSPCRRFPVSDWRKRLPRSCARSSSGPRSATSTMRPGTARRGSTRTSFVCWR